MPYRYGQIDPTEQYQGTAFDPMTGRLSGANIIMEFLARAAGEKERKKKESTEAEDREWQNISRELNKQVAEMTVTEKKRELQDYQTQAQKDKAERKKKIFETNEQIRQEAARIEAQGIISEKLKRLELAKAAEGLEYEDKKLAVKANQKTRQEQAKLYSLLVKQIEVSKKTVNTLRLAIQKAETDQDPGKRQILMGQLFQAQTDIDTYEAQRQNIAAERTGIAEEQTPAKRGLPNLPQKRTGPLGLVGPKVPYVPKSETEKSKRRYATDPKTGNRVYTEDGVTWFDEKTGKQVK